MFLRKALGAGAKVGHSIFGGGAITRPLLGGAIGGIYGGVTSENMNPTARLRDVIAGAAVGAGAGALLTKPVLSGIGRMGKRAGKGVKGIWGKTKPLFTEKGGIKAQETIEKMVLRGADLGVAAGKSALQNPLAALAITGGTFGLGALAYSAASREPGTPVNPVDYMNQNRLPSTGFDPSRGDLHQSTFGLTQGMWKGRHG